MTANADHQQPRLAEPATAGGAGHWVDDDADRPGRELPSEQTDGRVGLAQAARAQQQAHALAAQSDVLLLQEGARRVAVLGQPPAAVRGPGAAQHPAPGLT